jgi:hydroxyacylglutathione hydrolase
MSQEIKTIHLWDKHFLLRGFGGVNCYLVKTDAGYFLIDTGFHARRANLVQELDRAGCKPGNLKPILITHGDLDHTGNCAYLRKKHGTEIAAHHNEAEAVESGNMALSRKSKPGLIAGTLLSFFSLLSKSDRFKPDLYVKDGHDLSAYGFNAQALFIPGHSKGSIGILTANRDLFCGDLLWNMGKPEPQPNIDDLADLTASIERVNDPQIRAVYPRHGRPFLMEQFMQVTGTLAKGEQERGEKSNLARRPQ